MLFMHVEFAFCRVFLSHTYHYQNNLTEIMFLPAKKMFQKLQSLKFTFFRTFF